jgi:hypothetical protein
MAQFDCAVIGGGLVGAALAAALGVPMDEVGAYRVRPPIKPLSVGELAGLEGLTQEPRNLSGLPGKGQPTEDLEP